MLRNITLSAEENLIAGARDLARQEHTTLNNLFRKWLLDYSRNKQSKKLRLAAYEDIMKRLDYVNVGRKFTREEMNAR